MTTSYIQIPPHGQREYMNTSYYLQFTDVSRFIKLYPGDTHQKWGEVIDAWQAGIKVRITRVKNNPSCSGASYKLGSIHFIPMERVKFAYATEEEATGYSFVSYKDEENMTWDEFIIQGGV